MPTKERGLHLVDAGTIEGCGWYSFPGSPNLDPGASP